MNTPETFVAPIIEQLQILLTTAASDWRYWFAHVITWLVVAKLKLWWDHLPQARANRLTEAVATFTCFGVSLWVFAGYEHIYKVCLANGLLNTYGYKLFTLILDRVGLGGIAAKLRGTPYRVSKRPVEEEALEHGVAATEETVFLFRQGDGKTIAVNRSELGKYKVNR